MLHTTSLITAIVSLALIAATYFISLRSRPDAWLRDESVTMILLAFFTGFFSVAVVGSLMGLWKLLSAGLSMDSAIAAGEDLAGLALVIVTMIIFRALVSGLRRQRSDPNNVTPLSPKPVAPSSSARSLKKAA
ncbi:MAG: hypothetical protein R3E83_05785 [Burkholderiaceae bacterium]